VYFLLVHNVLYKLWLLTPQGYWFDLPYAARERESAERLLSSYRSRWPKNEYSLAPVGFTPNLAWCG